MSPSRADSPTRVPLTGGAAGYTGYEMSERKPNIFERPQTPTWRKEEQKTIRRRKQIIWGIIIFVVLGAVAGVTIYLVKFRNTSSGGNSGSIADSSKGRNGAGSTAGNIQKDSKLKLVFDGMDYTPLNAQYPACGAIQDNVTADVATLSQLTKQVRLYGTDCNQTEMVLNAIQSLKVDMTVFVGVWVDTNATTLARQLADMYSILKKYPASLIDGIAVGNEVLFREDKTESELIELISEVRTNVTAMNLGKKLPICTR
jgi:exo-beta-1,3-glucanase (GH17 family)